MLTREQVGRILYLSAITYTLFIALMIAFIH